MNLRSLSSTYTAWQFATLKQWQQDKLMTEKLFKAQDDKNNCEKWEKHTGRFYFPKVNEETQ